MAAVFSYALAAEQPKNTYCRRVHAHAIENTTAAAQSERKERAAVRSECDDEKRAQKRHVSQRRRLAARWQKRRSRHYRRFINPSLRLVESFGSASVVAATPKEKFWNVQSLDRQNTYKPILNRNIVSQSC